MHILVDWNFIGNSGRYIPSGARWNVDILKGSEFYHSYSRLCIVASLGKEEDLKHGISRCECQCGLVDITSNLVRETGAI